MNENHFRRYLETTHRGAAGKPLSTRAAGDYVSRCRRVEALLGCDLDAIELTLEAAATRVEARAGDLATDGVRSLQTAVRRYFDFRQHRASDFLLESTNAGRQS